MTSAVVPSPPCEGVGAIVVAAGAGTRLGGGLPKALIDVAGRPLVVHAVRAMVAGGLPAPVVVYPPGHRETILAVLSMDRVSRFVPGGATRTDSVRRGLAALSASVRIVAVHDAARPIVPAVVVRRVLDALREGVLAAAPALPVADTLKRVTGEHVIETVDRRDLVGVQTPQIFDRSALDEVLAGDGDATDELALVERGIDAGRLTGRIVTVPGSAFAHKVTYQHDLDLVAALAQALQGTPP